MHVVSEQKVLALGKPLPQIDHDFGPCWVELVDHGTAD